MNSLKTVLLFKLFTEKKDEIREFRKEKKYGARHLTKKKSMRKNRATCQKFVYRLI